MPPEVPKWLEDIRNAAQYILSATQGKTLQANLNLPRSDSRRESQDQRRTL